LLEVVEVQSPSEFIILEVKELEDWTFEEEILQHHLFCRIDLVHVLSDFIEINKSRTVASI
jgi:hypothetical protein